MLLSLKERKSMMHSERKRMWLPTLVLRCGYVQEYLLLYSQPKGVKQKYILCISGLVAYRQYIYTTAVVR